VFDFAAFSFEPKLEGRTSRIVGTDWDMTGALFDGPAGPGDLERTERELPKLYGGRAVPHTLVWCRSNRSLRLFEHVVASLADGRQPDAEQLWNVGYLMRNTGLDGNGTFGTRSYLALDEQHPLAAPLQAQMLAAYLMREFGTDLAERLAAHRALAAATPGRATALAPELRSTLGLGNASALGLVFFANNHPRLIDRLISLREQALRQVLEAVHAPGHRAELRERIERTARFHEQDPHIYDAFPHPSALVGGLNRAVGLMDGQQSPESADALPRLWDEWNRELDEAVVEALAGALIDSAPTLTDALVARQRVDETLVRRPEAAVRELLSLLRRDYAWALETDLTDDSTRRHIWYKSAAAEEPRRGPREEVAGGFDWGINLPAQLQALADDLGEAAPDESVGWFCVRHPEHRASVERVQGLSDCAFHSPRMNPGDEAFVPAQVVRFLNSAVHGLDKTVDSAGRNVLGLLFHGAPSRHDVDRGDVADWTLPTRPAQPPASEEL
jgi:hypothetical protein